MNEQGPLGFPEGTVRAIIAVVVVLGTIVYWIVNKTVPQELLAIAMIIVGWYFGARTGETLGQAKEIISYNYTKNGGANGNDTCTDTTTGKEAIRR